MAKDNNLDNILIQMKVVSEERIKELRTSYNVKEKNCSFNKFLINNNEITYEQLRVALLRQKLAVG